MRRDIAELDIRHFSIKPPQRCEDCTEVYKNLKVQNAIQIREPGALLIDPVLSELQPGRYLFKWALLAETLHLLFSNVFLGDVYPCDSHVQIPDKDSTPLCEQCMRFNVSQMKHSSPYGTLPVFLFYI